MDLKTICMNNLVNLIKNLPPLLKEEVIGQSIKTIREEERLKIMKEIKRSASVVVDDVTEKIINSYTTGKSWTRPGYSNDIDNDLYQTFVDISQTFVDRHSDQICFERERTRRRFYYESDNGSDQESDQESCEY